MKLPKRKEPIKGIVEWFTISISFIASAIVLTTYVYPKVEFVSPINILISVLVVVIVGLVVYIAYILTNLKLKIEYGRGDLIRTGQTLISGTKSMAVLISGDMSWIDSYITPINEAIRNGKKISIFYFDSGSTKVKDYSDRLSKTGANLIGLKKDPLLRATIIDPDDPDDSILFMVKRALIIEPSIISIGDPRADDNYTYIARIIRRGRDRWLFDTVIAFYHYLESFSQASINAS